MYICGHHWNCAANLVRGDAKLAASIEGPGHIAIGPLKLRIPIDHRIGR